MMAGSRKETPGVAGALGTSLLLIFAAGLLCSPLPRAQQARGSASDADAGAAPAGPLLLPTIHPAVPSESSHFWLAPEIDVQAAHVTAHSALAAASRSMASGDGTAALDVLSDPAARRGILGPYVMYLAAQARLRLGEASEARRGFQEIQALGLDGYLREAAALGEAQSHDAFGEHAAAADAYDRLARQSPGNLEDVLIGLGRSARAAGDLARAERAFRRVYYEFPLGEAASVAGAELATLPQTEPLTKASARYALELARAERLFSARQYDPARDAFAALRPLADGDDRDLVRLRLAECDYHRKRARAARDGLRAYLDEAARPTPDPVGAGKSPPARHAEALYFYALSTRDLGNHAGYLETIRRLVAEFPGERWAEDALNHLATHHIRRNDDERADEVLRELYERYPKSPHAERAAWKVGWRAYRFGRYGDAVRFFERAAADFPRSDFRPSWLYWSGRAREALGERAIADARYSLVIADYRNSYYGRLAIDRLGPRPRLPASVPVGDRGLVAAERPAAAASPPNAALVRALLSIPLYDFALGELRFAQRRWGDSPVIQATMAWIQQQQAREETGTERFNLLRGAINRMRRAYPQFLAEGGEHLPRDVLTVIFPLDYRDLIERHAAAQRLDPYLVAALVAQESTFVADIRSAANAWGLMQLIPSTARAYARRLKLPYSSRLLRDPDANVRMGTAYLADKIREFGDLHVALASYNAGERAVRRWLAERPGLARDEFIDDIPYPETQGYVKRVLGTTEDYRRLYGGVMASVR
jgi:soluble lytic murein transglycosylase